MKIVAFMIHMKRVQYFAIDLRINMYCCDSGILRRTPVSDVHGSVQSTR